ncbi:TIGR01777 family oxidoreductase [Alkalicoccus halolimnae]|uniref:TIGR01777 family oxidoreductase n=1 Tax=Alkalicoccus halolimnae TaxID=1667239 RepID=A0A5C7F519_9BACI|nr:TIGR01777 family oxidoreductase [Alkalicoccus halolimnae]TXF85173.1 TIGR01777 family protein [Alkalicoccus halolimnae]
MKVAIAGGTGLVGKNLTKLLLKEGHEAYILTRNPQNKIDSHGIQYIEWMTEGAAPEEKLEGIDAFVNLAGENLNSGRWTEKKKQEILDSRIDVTRETVRILSVLNNKPSVLINGSAVGFYGTSFEKTFTEETTTPGDDFMAEVVSRWEQEAQKAPDEVRVVLSRSGVVLSAEEGALKKMLPAFKMGVGGKLGTGEQWMSWIHVDDVARAILYLIEHEELSGPVNVTSPTPERMKSFGKTLADVLNRPFWAPVPSNVLKLILGDMSVIIVEGQQVIPQKLLDNGFDFNYPQLEEAFYDLIGE